MGSAAADVPPNQTALHEAGAVQLLLHEMQWSEVAGVVQGSMFALGSLVKGNTDAQSVVERQVKIETVFCLMPQPSSCVCHAVLSRQCY